MSRLGGNRYDQIKAGWALRRGFSDEDVLGLVGAGLSREATAERLGCSAKTVSRIAAAHRKPVVRQLHDNSPWTEPMVQILRDEWAKGTSTLKIAGKVGVSKNSVCGKVDRLDLPARPHLAKAKDDKRVEMIREAKPRKRLSLLHAETPKRRGDLPEVFAPLPPVVEIAAPKPVIEPPRPPEAKVYQFRRVRECTWIDGGDGTPWVCCQDPAEPGSSWCATHKGTVFVHKREKIHA